MSQHQLASTTGISPAQLSQTAERLRQRGWIVLTRSSIDRRRQSLELTAKGSAELQAASQRLKKPAENIIGDTASPMHAEIAAFLRQIAPSIQEYKVPAEAQRDRSGSQRKEAA